MSAPDLAAAAQAFAELCQTIAALRDPVGGCPWDLQQDHASLRRYMIEEAYEAAEAMDGGSPAELRDELGDVLLQVVLNAQIAHDAATFSVVEVIQALDQKMRRRHPHVFGAPAERLQSSAAELHRSWDVIKAAEKAAGPAPAAARGRMADAERTHPATRQAQKIGKLAAKVRFDWDSVPAVFAQVRAEVDELAAELAAPAAPPARVADELGDVYFSLAQLCRHLELDPEVVAGDANRKFLRRFARLEALAGAAGLAVEAASRDQLEEFWRQVKVEERRPSPPD